MEFASQTDEEQLSETKVAIDYLGFSSVKDIPTALSVVYDTYYSYKLMYTDLKPDSENVVSSIDQNCGSVGRATIDEQRSHMDASIFSSQVGSFDQCAILSQNEINGHDNSSGRCSEMNSNEFS